jgi:hypothetical protein
VSKYGRSLLPVALLEAGLFVTKTEVAFMTECHRAEAGVFADARQSGRLKDLGCEFHWLEVLRKTRPGFWLPSRMVKETPAGPVRKLRNYTKAELAASRAMHKIVNVLRADFYQRKRRGEV